MDPAGTVWDDIAAERLRFAALIDELDDAQLASPSLCGEWTVHDVAAHVVMPLIIGKLALARAMLAARGNFHRANAVLAKQTAARPPAELAALLRRHAASHFTPPMHPPAAPLTDLLIHGQDVRRPLGLGVDLDPARLRTALDFVVTARAHPGFVRKGRLAGLRLRATDVDWTHGDGAEVSGPGEAILLAATGREVALADLSGAGVEQLSAGRPRS